MYRHRMRLLMAGAVLLIWLLNAALFYMNYCSGAYLQYSDVYGNRYSVSRNILNVKNAVYKRYMGVTETTGQYLEEELAQNTLYKNVIEYARSGWDGLNGIKEQGLTDEAAEQLYEAYAAKSPGMTDEERLEELLEEAEALRQVQEQINRNSTYADYIDSVMEQADMLLTLSFYQSDAFSRRNIVKTKKDFYGLYGLSLQLVNEELCELLLFEKITDILAVLLTLLIFVVLFWFQRSAEVLYQGRGTCMKALLLLAAGIAGMYVCDAALITLFLGELSLTALVQSLASFRQCINQVNIGMLYMLSVASKLAGCLLIWLTLAAVVTARKGVRAAVLGAFGVFYILEAAWALSGGGDAFHVFAREVNVYSLFSLERFYMRYLNLNIAGMAVSRLPVFLCAAGALWGVTAVLAFRNIHSCIVQLKSREEQRYYGEMNRRYLEIRELRHDIGNHLLVVQALIESGEIAQAKKYLAEVSEQNEQLALPVKTGAHVLDALLLKKLEQARAMNTTVSFEVSCPLGNCGISDYELCTIFGNLLDNALEAVQKPELERTVRVVIGKQMDMLYIRCENPFSGALKQKGGVLQTTKPDASFHGYGLSRVRETVKKHGGELRITAREQMFCVEILMNIQEERQNYLGEKG